MHASAATPIGDSDKTVISRSVDLPPASTDAAGWYGGCAALRHPVGLRIDRSGTVHWAIYYRKRQCVWPGNAKRHGMQGDYVTSWCLNLGMGGDANKELIKTRIRTMTP